MNDDRERIYREMGSCLVEVAGLAALAGFWWAVCFLWKIFCG